MMMLSVIDEIFLRPHPKKNVNIYEKITEKSEKFLQKMDEGTLKAIISQLQLKQ